MDKLAAKIRTLAYTLIIIGMVSAFGIVVLTTADVGARFLIGKGVEGSIEICEMLMVLIAFLGLAWAETTDIHVKVEFIFNKIPPRIQIVLQLFTKSLTTACLLILAYASISSAWSQYQAGEVTWAGTRQIPVWPARYCLAIGVVVFCAVSLFEIVHDAVNAWNKGQKEA